ncbi:hypothetical protein SODG_006066 [Sodalis praecaptivus]
MNKTSRLIVLLPHLITCSFMCMALISYQGIAATVQTSFKISEIVTNGCQISQTKDIDFGSLSIVELVDKRPVATGEIDVLCTPGVAINVTLDGGASAVNKQRNMKTTGHQLLAYDIFSDSSYTQIWPPDSSHKYGGGTGDPLIIPLYARLDTHGAIMVAGKYHDVINITVSY